ncbi:MAG: WecB/TagA/CpsF family glycosyltransferase [Clostridiales bacterium]|jgi:N-acetylglucosaminyldiphosphoundecaprenol N-acetyl-beta-D-mannosaminyltransferase|nr:WecB/TagA/CpsF family glycosyltransferase [Clostridiales bacterium]
MKESILGIPTDIVTLDEAVTRVQEMLNDNKPHFIASVNPEICLAAQENNLLKEILKAADLGIPDGIGIILASKLRRGQIRARVTGIDLMQSLVKLAASEKKSIYLYGAAEGVAAEAAANLTKAHPGLQIAGIQHGYIATEQEGEVAKNIAASKADMVFIGLGSPRQEFFVSHHGNATKAKVLMVVGGSFDVLSGRLPRAPQIYQRLGIEWLYRLLLQPTRLKRALNLPRFLLQALVKKS